MNKLHILLAVLCITAAALAKKHRRHEHISKSEDTQSVQVESHEKERPRPHGFAIAIRIPKIAIMPGGMHMDMKDDDMKKMPDMKTTTKTENSTDGPYKTFTVTEESVSPDNKTVMESVKSITTLDSKNLTPEQKKKLADGELQDDEHHIKIPNLFHWRFRFPFGAAHDEMEPPKPECDEKKPCKNGLYCDEGLCNKMLEPGARCYKKDQCDTKQGKYQCTWGVCALNSVPGSPGTFCDDDNTCSSQEDMTCRFQNDISPKDKVCLPKLGEEGAFCGKVSFFSFFATNRDFNLCKTGLACKVVGFRGLKRCVKEAEFPASLQKDSRAEETHKEPEQPSHDDEKIVFTKHHHKHHRHLD